MPGAPCARHPSVETYVRCQRCDTPICPQCMVSTPVGMKCRDCTSNTAAPYLRSSASEAVLAFLGASAVALLTGWVLTLCFFTCIPYGALVGEAALRCGRRKRGVTMQAIAGLAALIGAAPWLLLGDFRPLLWVFAAIGAFFAYSRVRYI